MLVPEELDTCSVTKLTISIVTFEGPRWRVVTRHDVPNARPAKYLTLGVSVDQLAGAIIVLRARNQGGRQPPDSEHGAVSERKVPFPERSFPAELTAERRSEVIEG